MRRGGKGSRNAMTPEPHSLRKDLALALFVIGTAALAAYFYTL
jgi:hypothetical protein